MVLRITASLALIYAREGSEGRQKKCENEGQP